MINEPTCLILGAGASVPYGLPTAEDLKSLILSGVTDAGQLAADKYALKKPVYVVSMGPSHHQAHKWATYLTDVTREAGLEHLRDKFLERLGGSPRGIDWFLRNNPDYEDIAKLHIAAVLLDRETAPPSGDWYAELSRQALPAHTRTFEPGMLSVITFNYDRSFERFFLTALQSDYNLSSADAEREFSQIKIEHVYGKLGSLADVPYGDVSRVAIAAKGITLSRATVDEAIQRRIQPLLESARYINFIGFGFDEDNLAILESNHLAKVVRTYSTSKGLSSHQKKRARSSVRAWFSPKHPELNALELLREFDIFGPKVAVQDGQQISRRRSSRWMSGFDLTDWNMKL